MVSAQVQTDRVVQFNQSKSADQPSRSIGQMQLTACHTKFDFVEFSKIKIEDGRLYLQKKYPVRSIKSLIFIPEFFQHKLGTNYHIHIFTNDIRCLFIPPIHPAYIAIYIPKITTAAETIIRF